MLNQSGLTFAHLRVFGHAYGPGVRSDAGCLASGESIGYLFGDVQKNSGGEKTRDITSVTG